MIFLYQTCCELVLNSLGVQFAMQACTALPFRPEEIIPKTSPITSFSKSQIVRPLFFKVPSIILDCPQIIVTNTLTTKHYLVTSIALPI